MGGAWREGRVGRQEQGEEEGEEDVHLRAWSSLWELCVPCLTITLHSSSASPAVQVYFSHFSFLLA